VSSCQARTLGVEKKKKGQEENYAVQRKKRGGKRQENDVRKKKNGSNLGSRKTVVGREAFWGKKVG